MDLDLNKTVEVPVVNLLSVLSPLRIQQIADAAEEVIYKSGARSADRLIIENAIRKALIEATVTLTATAK